MLQHSHHDLVPVREHACVVPRPLLHVPFHDPIAARVEGSATSNRERSTEYPLPAISPIVKLPEEMNVIPKGSVVVVVVVESFPPPPPPPPQAGRNSNIANKVNKAQLVFDSFILLPDEIYKVLEFSKKFLFIFFSLA